MNCERLATGMRTISDIAARSGTKQLLMYLGKSGAARSFVSGCGFLRHGREICAITVCVPHPTKSLNRKFVFRFRRWLTVQHYALSTVTHYCGTALRLCRFIGDRRLRDVTAMDISDFLSSKLPPQWSDGHISHQLQALRCFFDFLYLGGIVDAVAPRFLRARTPERRLPKTLTQARTKKLIGAADNPRDRALMELFYATGCRVGEVVKIRAERIDFKRRCFPVMGKRKERMVYFGSSAAKAIRNYLGQRRVGYLFQDIFPRQKGYVTRSRVAWTGNWRDYRNGGRKRMKYLGNPARLSYAAARRKFNKYLRDNKIDLERPKPDRPMTRSTLGRIVQDIGRRADLGVVNPHMLRHSFATHMLERGADIRAIQELLGHAYLTSTQVYTRVSNNAVAATFRRCHPRGA